MTQHDRQQPVIGLTYSAVDLVQYPLWRHMLRGFAQAGAAVMTLDCHLTRDDLPLVVAQLDGLVLSGGYDVDPRRYGGDPLHPLIERVDPVRDANEEAALATALEHQIPVLAVCRGVQLVNVLFGGTLYADLPESLGAVVSHRRPDVALDRTLHEVDVEPDSLLAQWLGTSGTVAVNSEHHQGIRDLAPGLRPVATAADGLIEGVEDAARRLVGVQWHPEIVWPDNADARRLLRGFVSEAAGARASVRTANRAD